MNYKSVILLFSCLAIVSCASSPSPILPAAALKQVDNKFKIEKVWSTSIGDGVSDQYLKLSPVVADGIVYATDHEGLVSALKLDTAEELWTVELELPISSGLSLTHNSIFFGTSKGEVISLNKSNGAIQWRAQLSSEILAVPRSNGELVITRCVDGQVHALDFNTGKIIWTHIERTPRLTLRGVSSPVISNDIVLASFDDGVLVALNLHSGRIIWQKPIAVARGRTDIERLIDADADPIVIKDVVYAVNFQGRLVAMQLGSGRTIWSRDVSSYAGITVDPKHVFVTGASGEIWALDRLNGATLWRQDALLRRGVTRSQLHGQYIVVGDFMGYIHWLRRDTGEIVARIRMNQSDYAHPSLEEPAPGTIPRSTNILVAPIADGNKLIAADRNGTLEAFEIHYP